MSNYAPMLLSLHVAACAIPPDISFDEGVATKLMFAKQPMMGFAGAELDTIIVAITDDRGTPIARAQHEITLSLRDNPSDGALLGAVTVAAIGGGAAYFDGVAIDKPGAGYTLAASAVSLTPAVSDPFDLAPAAGAASSGPRRPSQLGAPRDPGASQR